MCYAIFPFLLSILLFSSCANKHYSQEKFMAPSSIFLCIEMPQNKLVFENLSPMVYDALWNHFNRVGYRLVEKRHKCREHASSDVYNLRVTIKDVDSSYKFLSPDLLTYAVKMRVELLCQLFDGNNNMKMQKAFMCSSLMPRARDYVENSKFSDFEYKRLFEQYAPKIDYYFRPFLLKRS